MGHWNLNDCGGEEFHINTADLAATLDALPADAMINMQDPSACLGVRTIERLLPDAYNVRFFYGHGNAENGEGVEFDIVGTTAVEDFIQIAVRAQLGEVDALSVADLRDKLNLLINTMSLAGDI